MKEMKSMHGCPLKVNDIQKRIISVYNESNELVFDVISNNDGKI
jgi:hypothetical protein